ncbi:hypothetical protein L208DRAFT_1506239, partial [Tricholoma matsutake]
MIHSLSRITWIENGLLSTRGDVNKLQQPNLTWTSKENCLGHSEKQAHDTKREYTKEEKEIRNGTLADEVELHSVNIVPVGTQWQNNSCAYDAALTILLNIWWEDP